MFGITFLEYMAYFAESPKTYIFTRCYVNQSNFKVVCCYFWLGSHLCHYIFPIRLCRWMKFLRINLGERISERTMPMILWSMRREPSPKQSQSSCCFPTGKNPHPEYQQGFFMPLRGNTRPCLA